MARDVAVLVGVGTGAGLTLTLLAILALRAVVVPTPGISVYRPTADPLALLAIAAFMAVVGADRRLRAGAARGDGGSARRAALRLRADPPPASPTSWPRSSLRTIGQWIDPATRK